MPRLNVSVNQWAPDDRVEGARYFWLRGEGLSRRTELEATLTMLEKPIAASGLSPTVRQVHRFIAVLLGPWHSADVMDMSTLRRICRRARNLALIDEA